MALKVHKNKAGSEKIFRKTYKKLKRDDIINHVHTNMEGEI